MGLIELKFVFRKLKLENDRWIIEKEELFVYSFIFVDDLNRALRADLLTLEDLNLTYELVFSSGFTFSNVYGYHAYNDEDVESYWESKLEFIDSVLTHAEALFINTFKVYAE